MTTTSNSTNRPALTWRFLTPLERTQPTLDELLWRAWPDSTQSQRKELIERGKVTVDERLVRDPRKQPAPQSVVSFSPETGEEVAGLPEVEELARGEGWVLVDKPIGMPAILNREDPMNSVLFMADLLGLDRDVFMPAMHVPTQAGGPWLCGFDDEAAERLRDAWRGGEMMMTFRAIALRQERAQGSLTGPGGLHLSYAVTRYDEGLCELQLIPQYREKSPKGAAFEPFSLIRKTLAQAGIALLGDRQHGGYMVEGGLRLRMESIVHDASGIGHSWSMPQDWWPSDPVVDYEPEPKHVPSDEDDADDGYDASPDQEWRAEEAFEDDLPDWRKKDQKKKKTLQIHKLKVSDKTLEIMESQGHPWVLEDSHTGGRSHLKPGTLVGLTGKRSKRPGPWALVEGPGELAARKWADAEDIDAVEFFSEEVLARVDEAIVRRADLLKDMAQTNIFRLIHGEADGLPGLNVDRVGAMLRATLTGQSCRVFRKLVYDNLMEHDPHATLIEVWHTEDVRQRGDLPVARLVHGAPARAGSERTIGLEDGLKYWCEPWEGIDVGFFSDQRDNRRTLKRDARPGQRWLNLFGHTGAFSVALASCGAQVVNVDVSKRYLDWTRENFLLNGLDPDLDVPAALDARTYIAQMKAGEQVDGIIVDPPTAAQGKAGFWSVRKDYADLLVACFERLKPGGVMLVCRNDRKAKGGLDEFIKDSGRRAKADIKALTIAPPSHDYPRLEGFPEGDHFDGWIVRLKS